MQLLSILGTCTGIRGIPSNTTIILDTFTAANGTLVTARPPDVGPTPIAIIGSPVIQGNSAEGNASANYTAATYNASVSNCTVTCNFKNIGTLLDSFGGLIARQNGSGAQSYFNLSAQNTGWALLEWLSGTPTNRGAGGSIINVGQTYALKMILNGTGIACYVDGVNIINYSSSNYLTNTYFGIQFYGSSGGSYDEKINNFKVTS